MAKVLFVDDEPPVCRAFLFAHEPYFELLVAASGPEAMDLLANHDDIGLVVTDIKMPEMDGIQLADRIRKRYPRVRIIIHTANMNIGYLKESINIIKADGFIEKVDMVPDALENTRSMMAKLLQDYINDRQKM